MDVPDATPIELGQPSYTERLAVGDDRPLTSWRAPFAVAAAVLLVLLSGSVPVSTQQRPQTALTVPYPYSIKMVGNLAIIASDGWIQARELPGQQVLWQRPAEINSLVRAVVGDLVIVSHLQGRAAQRGEAYTVALDLVTGIPRWEHPGEVVIARPELPAIILFDATRSDAESPRASPAQLISVGRASGVEKWSVAVAALDTPVFPPEGSAAPVAFVSPAGGVRLIDPTTGIVTSPRGHVDPSFLGGYVKDGILVANQGEATGGGATVAYELVTLTEVWRRPLDPSRINQVVPSTDVAIATEINMVEAIDGWTGTRQWRRDMQFESLLALPDGEALVVGRELDADRLPGPAAIFRARDGARLAVLDLWSVVGLRGGEVLVLRQADGPGLRTWLGWVDLAAGRVSATDLLDGLEPGAECAVDGDWLLCRQVATRTMLVFRL
ncbi:hypothetical protein F4553_005847 [Allocatelliglobosispora scoriae]|uniref:Pyrrolo-quinoline quinone repeat domain-containing protein n=1 Tax=Allocatelliglobosispora scoriae TaxID=643052 RepID=A0A841BZU8_9ACTN|nr:hypothetical protein [Allocatelliglobosispora scoriae]MBB5872413.1 hypothetical protein [Allocatelliglobosispora scoriae]